MKQQKILALVLRALSANAYSMPVHWTLGKALLKDTGGTGSNPLSNLAGSLRGILFRSIGTLAGLLIATGAWSATIWTGPDILYVKDSAVDYTTEAVDVLTSNVSLTRGNAGLLCNVTAGDPCEPFEYELPTDTEWAVGSIADWDSLSYSVFLEAMPTESPGSEFAGTTFVVHLISDDIYLALTGESWQNGNSGGCNGDPWADNTCGGVSYSRSTAAVSLPAPAGAWFFAIVLGVLGWVHRKPAAGA